MWMHRLFMKKFLKLFNELFYPEVVIVLLPQIFLGYLASQSLNIFSFFYASLMIILVDFAGNGLNHYADWELDEVNNKRIFLHQNISKNKILSIFFLLSIVLFLMMIVNFVIILITIAGWLSAVLYSTILKLKDKVFINYLTLGFAYTIIPYCTGYFVASTDVVDFFKIIWLPIFLFTLMVVLACIKDYEDEEGDRIHNKKTFITIFGKEKSIIFQFFSLTILIVLTLIWNLILLKFIILLILFPYILSLRSFIRLWKAKTSEECHKEHVSIEGISIIYYLTLIPYFFI